MSGFTDELIVRYISGPNWALERQLPFWSDVLTYRGTISHTVPTGFVTDFFSVPSWCRWLIPANGDGNQAAVVHDWLYKTQARVYNRRECDLIFADLLSIEKLGVSKFKQKLIFWAVRIGGPRHYWKG